MTFDKDVPVLMLVFNRPELTLQVFEQVRKAAPKFLYVAADGPRDSSDEEDCNKVKEIFKSIDWDCELKTLYRTENMGCGLAVSTGIQWFFNEVESGIVLEDDCLPNQSFFAFCSDMLNYYSKDYRIGHISGSNFQDGQNREDGSYYYSALTHVWGWASWKRVWKDYDYKISTFSKFDTTFAAIPSHVPFAENWKDIFNKVSRGEINTWDFQYAYLILAKGYKSIMPNVNLIRNIGMGNNSTHTSADHPLLVSTTQELLKIKHPTFFIQDVNADIYTQNKEFYISTKKKGLLSVAWKNVKNLLKK